MFLRWVQRATLDGRTKADESEIVFRNGRSNVAPGWASMTGQFFGSLELLWGATHARQCKGQLANNLSST